MKLGKKNLFYSMLLAGCMLAFLVGYFVYMLPSLYVDHMMEQNLKAVKEQHRVYVESGSYADVQVKNPTACFSVRMPDTGDSIYVAAKLFSMEISVEDGRFREMFDDFRRLLKDYDENGTDTDRFREQMGEKTEEWENIFKKIMNENVSAPSLPFQFKILQQDVEGGYVGEYEKIHPVSDNLTVFEMGVEDASNQYVNYIAVERTGNGLVLTFLPVVTPDMNEIRPVVFQSLPMLGAVIFLLVLLFSQVYSRGIVSPVIRLVQYTELMKNSHKYKFEVFPADRDLESLGRKKDEIGLLAATIDELYRTIRAGYMELEEKNKALAEENERKEVLLRASSHQLKTPVSAALLLVDGMKNKIGKYQDTEAYLPKVKEQLLSMKKMVEDILYLNHCGDHPDLQKVPIRGILERQLAACRIPVADKHLNVRVRGGEDIVLDTDETLFARILENILSNAVNYTPPGERIEISLTGQEIRIQNFGIRIPEELLPHIFEAFVSGNHEKTENRIDSHGLGLYIAAYYAKKIGMKIDICNEGDSVVAVIQFHYIYMETS